VKPEDAFHALDNAHAGAMEEGNVGGGSGIICNEFKGGIGTSSRVLDAKYGGYTVGVLVQWTAEQLRIAGVPVGREIAGQKVWDDDVGSIIVVVATDAPLIPTPIEARRQYAPVTANRNYSGPSECSDHCFATRGSASFKHIRAVLTRLCSAKSRQ